MRVLFVGGFNPSATWSWNAHYDPVKGHFDASDHTVDYFTYTWTECADSVYARLSDALAATRYDSVVGHSMGGALVARYFTRKPDRLRSHASVVLCMPLISTDNRLHALLSHVPFIGLMPVPSSVLYVDRLLKCTFPLSEAVGALGLFCGQQIVHVYREWLPHLDIGMLASPNVRLIYATEDALCPLAASTVARAAHAYRVDGDHEAFNAPRSSGAFFAALERALIG
jgi:pimeloyl-ACP methyl ester carboxylesterase